GDLVILPTETVYGLTALAGSEKAVAALRQVAGLSNDVSLAWHVPSAAQPPATIPLRPSLHRRAVERVSAGPVTLLIDLTPDELDAVRTALGVPAGVIDDGSTLLLRIPGHEFAREALEALDAPAVMTGAAAKGQPAPTDAKVSLPAESLERVAMI